MEFLASQNINWVTIFEYGIGSLLLVFATVLIKILSSQIERLNWMEVLTIGLDVLMMTFFGAFIYGISVYNHFKGHPASAELIVICVIFGLFVLVVSLFLAVLTKYTWKDSPKKCFWFPNILAAIALIVLLMIVSGGNNTLKNNKFSNQQVEQTNSEVKH